MKPRDGACPALINDLANEAFGVWWRHLRNNTDMTVSHLAITFPALVSKAAVTLDSKPLLERLAELLADETGMCAWRRLWAVLAAAATDAFSRW